MAKTRTVSSEVQAIVNMAVKKAVKETVDEIFKKQDEQTGKRNCYKEVEKLLYSLPALEEKVKHDEEALNSPEIKPTGRSRDLVKFSLHGGTKVPFDIEQYTADRKRSMLITRMEVERIHKALKCIEGWEYYKIIELKYFCGKTLEEIAEVVNLDISNVSRQKSRMVRHLAILLFGKNGL